MRGDIELTTPAGKVYRLGEDPAVLIVRPRGLHLPEKHLYIDGVPISASLFDFGLNLFIAYPRRGRWVNVPTITCQSWNTTWKHDSGQMSLSLPNRSSTLKKARLR